MKVMNCELCGSPRVSSSIGVCVDCLRRRKKAVEIAKRAHFISRGKFGLPGEPGKKGIRCRMCANRCRIPEGSFGFCGMVKNEGGVLKRILEPHMAIGTFYLDPLPTNCVASYVCEECEKPSKPYNLAVFYGSCNLDCLFCQNWEYRRMVMRRTPTFTIQDLERNMHNCACICFFGGDPASQASHALASGLVAKENGLKVCFETNGLWNLKMLEKACQLTLESKGIFKIDFKAYSSRVYEALTGVSNRGLFRSIKVIKKFLGEAHWPFLVFSTLMVPYYVDLKEIDKISRLIAKIDPSIPYVLLAFHPCYMMRDLPFTSRDFAEKALKIAKDNGLEHVYIGNEWLLR